MTKTTTNTPARSDPDPDHPVAKARREALRGDPNELARMRDTLARTFGIRVDLQRLEAQECGELLRLHRQALEPEGWVADVRPYGLASRLSKAEQKRWRLLVGKAAGKPDLFDDLDEDANVAAKLRELVRRAMTPPPSSMHAPAGAAVIPEGAWDDVIEGRLLAVDLAVLTTIVLIFRSGRLHPKVERRQDAHWQDDGATLMVAGEATRLLPVWADDIGHGVDPVTYQRQRILARLTTAGWLAIETTSPRASRVRLGPRFTAGD